jgi:hypothetical protein
MGALTSSNGGYARAASDLGVLLLPRTASRHRNAHCYNLLCGLGFRQKQGGDPSKAYREDSSKKKGLPGGESEEGGSGDDGQDREGEEHRDGRAGAAGGKRAGDGRVLVHREHVPPLAAAARRNAAVLGPHRRGQCAAVLRTAARSSRRASYLKLGR